MFVKRVLRGCGDGRIERLECFRPAFLRDIELAQRGQAFAVARLQAKSFLKAGFGILRFVGKLIESGAATAGKLEEIATKVAKQVADAVAFSERSEPADTELVFDLMFAGQKP